MNITIRTKWLNSDQVLDPKGSRVVAFTEAGDRLELTSPRRNFEGQRYVADHLARLLAPRRSHWTIEWVAGRDLLEADWFEEFEVAYTND